LPDTSIIIHLFGIAPMIGCVMSGLICAHAQLINARSEAAEFRYKHGYGITLNAPTRRLADIDQRTAMRPFGMSTVLIGIDVELGSWPFRPSFVGYFAGFHAVVAGQKQPDAINHLGKKWKKLDSGRCAGDATSSGENLSREVVVEVLIEAISTVHAMDY
ncbi:nucleophile aminohydrolase, partial [Infundibulicybe gibba]